MRIVLLWHMHQPDYRDPESGVPLMPWVRLHAVQNYYDMARLVDEAPPGLKLCFNLTPVLLSQLRQISDGGPRDQLYELCRRPVARLSPAERAWLVEQLFSTNEERKIRPVAGYTRLFQKAGPHRGPAARTAPSLSDQELLDLQVFFHLAWSGRTLREDPFIAALCARPQGGFAEPERDRLLALQDELIPRIVPLYARLWAEGRIEVSTTPLHHPILPLLCDLRAAREGNPRANLADLAFRFPEDAVLQIREGLALAERELGSAPTGLWPSEGSLSEAVIEIMGAQEVRWAASDQHVLQGSLAQAGQPRHGSAHLYPWRLVRGTGPALFFRDNELSDRIGFSYARWLAADAVQDLVARARARGATVPDPEQACLCVVLDGENAWEFYEDHGVPFLAGLYRALAAAPDLEPATPSGVLAHLAPRPLPCLRAGSWIGASFDTWIGHPEKNRAWAALARARRAFEVAERRPGADTAALAEARARLLRAEASDWFWWLGDDHPSPHKAAFEGIFRTHLSAAWRALGHPPPADLERSLLANGAPELRLQQPTALIRPHIDGQDRRYYDWVGAGRFDASRQAGAIETGSARFGRLDFGFDTERLYLRLVPAEPSAARLQGAEVRLLLLTGEDASQRLIATEPGGALRLTGPGEGASCGCWAGDHVIELAVDLGGLGLTAGDPIALAVEVFSADGRVDRLPLDGTLRAQLPDVAFPSRHWHLG
ncbi:MAG: glycoside hydrolase family 57 protein [Pseudomonadota bacterium]